MTIPLAIDHLSVLDMPPDAFVDLAAAAGYRGVSLIAHHLGIAPFGDPAWSLVEDKALRRAVAARLAHHGIALLLGEGTTITRDRDVALLAPMLDMFAELGARRINIVSFEEDLARDLDQTCRLAELAASRGLASCVEFSARPGRPGLPAFSARAEQAGADILIDAMHFHRAGATREELATVDPARLVHLQLCDIRLDAVTDYGHAALHERLAPGDGTLPLDALVAALPADIAISLELPQVGIARSGMSHLDRLARAGEAARALIARARPARR